MMLMREMKMRAHPRRDVSLVIAGTGMSRSPGCLCVVMMNPQITNLHTVLYRLSRLPPVSFYRYRYATKLPREWCPLLIAWPPTRSTRS